jgi:replication factor A1
VTLKDKSNSEIRGTFFNIDAETWYGKIDVDAVYSVSGGKIKTANQRYNTTKSDYEITFDSTTRFEPVADDGRIGTLTYHYVDSLADLEQKKENSLVDVLAIVRQVEPLAEVTTKKGPSQRRRVFLCDRSDTAVEFTLWGADAEKFPDTAAGEVIQLKDVRVGAFHGKQLGMGSGSIWTLSPRDQAARDLKDWWDGGGEHDDFRMLSGGGGGDFETPVLYLSAIDEFHYGSKKDARDFFTFYGILMEVYVSRPLFYNACPNPKCKGKKLEDTGGNWLCRACSQQTKEPRERFLFQFRAADYSGAVAISAIGDDMIGEPLLGFSAHQWAVETRDLDEGGWKALIDPKKFSEFKFKVRVHADEYQQELRAKVTAINVTPINYAEAAKFFATEIQKY